MVAYGISQLMQKVATTSLAGYALVNGTPTILTWTAPNDGQMHRINVVAEQVTTSTATAGATSMTHEYPNGTGASPGIFGGGDTTSQLRQFQTDRLIASGSVVTVQQSTALTGGAVTFWAEIWAS